MNSHCLTLTPRHRSQLTAAARGAYPEECCGVLLGTSDDSAETLVECVVPARNLSADRRSAYAVDPGAILEALAQARAAGWTLVGFYHSHPDGSRRPSRRDRQDAWPDVSYVIVPRGGELTSWRRRAGDGFVAERIDARAAGGARR